MACKIIHSDCEMAYKTMESNSYANKWMHYTMNVSQVAFQNTWEKIKSNRSMKVGQTRWETVSLSDPAETENILQYKVAKCLRK